MVGSDLEKVSIHSFTMHLLNAYSMPEFELGARDLIVKKEQRQNKLLVLTEHMSVVDGEGIQSKRINK